MKPRHSIITLAAAAALALGGTTAQARILPVGTAGDLARAFSSSHYTAAELKAMGLRFRAAKNFREELVQLPSGGAPPIVRPDDRGGPRGT